MKKFKKIAVLAVVIMTFFTLCACGVSVDYYYESNGSQIFYRYDVTVPKAVVENLNSPERTEEAGKKSDDGHGDDK
jgi:lipoprotein